MLMLQDCVRLFDECFKNFNCDVQLGFNLFLVLSGARPGALLEVQDCLSGLAEQHGEPGVCRALRPVLDKLERNGSRGTAPTNTDVTMKAVTAYFEALQIEYMHVLLKRIRSLAKRCGANVRAEAHGAEIYLISSVVGEKDVTMVLGSAAHEENEQTFAAVARLLGYPVVKLADRQENAQTGAPSYTSDVNVEVVARRVGTGAGETFGLYGVWCKTQAQKTFVDKQVARMHDALHNQIFCAHDATGSPTWFVVDRVGITMASQGQTGKLFKKQA